MSFALTKAFWICRVHRFNDSDAFFVCKTQPNGSKMNDFI